MNQWVCLEGDHLIAHGVDALEVHRKAKEAGIEIPYCAAYCSMNPIWGRGNGERFEFDGSL